MWIAVAVAGAASPAVAQPPPSGYVSIFLDRLPNRDATELRARGFAEDKIDAGPHLRLTASGFVEGLLADRGGRVTDAVAEPQELNAAFHAKRIELAAGLGRVVWGRLDELQPTDVINPIDVSRFFFEGRSEARLSVPLVHATVYAGDKASIEGVWVPFFRRGRFDRLAEGSSPFDLTPPVPFTDLPPARTLGHAQGGARVNVTSGRVDWSVSAYRGFRPFGIYAAQGGIVRIYPRFTMVGGDFETVAGPWVVRGEAAAFVRDVFQAPDLPIALAGQSFDAGAALDRKAGSYRISGQILVHRENHREDKNDATDPPGRSDVSLVVSADRTFSREKYRGRLFGVYNPNSHSGFARGIATASLRDNVALEGSLGWFAGSGLDTISRFADSDFAYVRLKYFF